MGTKPSIMPVSKEVMALAAGTEVALLQRKSLLISANLNVMTSWKALESNSIKHCTLTALNCYHLMYLLLRNKNKLFCTAKVWVWNWHSGKKRNKSPGGSYSVKLSLYRDAEAENASLCSLRHNNFFFFFLTNMNVQEHKNGQNFIPYFCQPTN